MRAQRWSFALGTAAVTAGVLLHLPMYIGARHDHYILAGMPWDGWMIPGMVLIGCGYAAVLYGLAQQFAKGTSLPAELEFKALDETRLRPAHLKLMAVLTFAIAIDTQKPFTFTFILPGVAKEYGLSSPAHPAPGHWSVALFPLIGIIGTVLGSLAWGHLADRIGRRPALLLAAVMFIGSAMCAAMPEFTANLVACFIMGLGAGGLLPIAYSLLTEMIPARRRGQMVVLVAGVGTALGFLFASWTANWFVGDLGWRIMWWLSIPTGLALIGLNRYMPESPRFLLEHGRRAEAHAVLDSFGIEVGEAPAHAPAAPVAAPEPAGFVPLFRRPFTGITTSLAVYGIAWGLGNFGFLVWLPVHLSSQHISPGHTTYILAKAALFSIPGAVLTSWLYGRWSSRLTLILAAGLTSAALAIFAIDGNTVARHNGILTALLVVLLVSMWAMISVLAPYAAEVYPTRMRGLGSGVVAGASKLGGVLALSLSVSAVAPPSLSRAALITLVPAAVAALMLAGVGIETAGKRLEEISASEPARIPAA